MPPLIPDRLREVPPTAGLPLRLTDLLPLSAGKTDFSAGIADFLGVPEVGVECSGTAALIVILQTLQRPGGRRKVIVPAYTCPLVALAVAHCGLQLVVCDVAPGSFALAPDRLAELCDGDTLAVIPTHLAGRVADLGPVLAVARANGAWVIEDAAQAFGARSGGKSVGLAGDAGFFSFAAGKGLSIFEGGAWLAGDPAFRAELARTSRTLIPSAPLFETGRCLQLLGLAAFYRPWLLPYVYGMPLRRALRRNDPVQAVGDIFSPEIPLHRVSAWRRAVGSRALLRLPDFQAALACQAEERLARLACLPGLTVLGDAPGARGVWPFLMLLLPSRDAVLHELWGGGLGVTRLFVDALPDYDYLRPWVAAQDCPNARDFAARSLTLSNSPWLDAAGFERIVAVIERCLDR